MIRKEQQKSYLKIITLSHKSVSKVKLLNYKKLLEYFGQK